jgi:hypothetical protein
VTGGFRSNPETLCAQVAEKRLEGHLYGDPVLERRRPGGSDLAEISQGSQADLSLPSGCADVSYTKAQQQGLRQGSGSVRANEMMRESAKAEESFTSSEPLKAVFGDE